MGVLARFIGLVFVCFFIGCASTRQYERVVGQPEMSVPTNLLPTAGKAKIYVLRRSSVLGAAVAIRIADTGRLIGKIGPGGVLTWEREPGELVLGASASNESNITLTVKEGEVYFVEARTNWGAGFNSAACEIRLLSNDEGQMVLAKLTQHTK